MTDSLALYIHFPFCLSICPYCDFDRQATGFDRIDVYLETLERELTLYAARRARLLAAPVKQASTSTWTSCLACRARRCSTGRTLLIRRSPSSPTTCRATC